MAQYKIILRADAVNINVIRKQVEKWLPGQVAQIDKVNRNPSRQDRFDEAVGEISSAKGTLEDLRDELQEWVDNIPENMQGGSKADEINDAISSLEEAIGQLEEAEGADVTFPGMMA